MNTVTLADALAASSASRTQHPMDRTLSVVGARSAILLCVKRSSAPRRFALPVAFNEPMAASRLRELVADGLPIRVPYQEPATALGMSTN